MIKVRHDEMPLVCRGSPKTTAFSSTRWCTLTANLFRQNGAFGASPLAKRAHHTDALRDTPPRHILRHHRIDDDSVAYLIDNAVQHDDGFVAWRSQTLRLIEMVDVGINGFSVVLSDNPTHFIGSE
jgi:hypothetical protein